MTGLLVLIAALAATGIVAAGLRWKNGRFATAASADRPQEAPAIVLSADDIGASLGSAATLVQFSTAFCAPCRTTRVVLADVAGRLDGVVAVDVDAESSLDLVRRLDIVRTPTVLILDPAGAIRARASGAPTRDQVVRALQGLLH